ncbi:MAG: transposase, partial [Pseudonocardiaceae bacterium]
MGTITRVATALHTILTETADAAARDTGLVRRKRKLTGSVLVRLLVWGYLGRPGASLGDLSQVAAVAGVAVSSQAIAQRCTPAAAVCLEHVLAAAVHQVVVGGRRLATLLNRFTAILVLDSSTVRLPAALAAVWPGCGGRTPGRGAAALKLQVAIDLCTGTLAGPDLSAGREQDRAAPLQHAVVPAGALRIADLGYHSLAQFAAIGAGAGFFLSRYHPQTVVFDQT